MTTNGLESSSVDSPIMRIVQVAWTAHHGGAARAVARLHEALNEEPSNRLQSWLVSACREDVLDRHVSGLPTGWQSVQRFVSAAAANSMLSRRTSPDNFTSFPLVSTGILKTIQRLEPSAVLFHWLGTQTMSVREIVSVPGKRIWYAHDLWITQLTEHLPSSSNFGPPKKHRFVDRLLYAKKLDLVASLDGIIAPSEQMADRVSDSLLTRDVPTEVVPPPINLAQWRPLDKRFSRRPLNISSTEFVVGFAADGGLSTAWKGGHTFIEALERVAAQGVKVRALVAGSKQDSRRYPFPITFLGRLTSLNEMRQFYGASDIVVCPSTFESFGQVASEAQAMGKPVVAFRGSGLESVVAHEKTGFVVQHSVQSLAQSIVELANCESLVSMMGEAGRRRVERLFSYREVRKQLLAGLNRLL